MRRSYRVGIPERFIAFGAGGRFVGGGTALQRFFLVAETPKPRNARL